MVETGTKRISKSKGKPILFEQLDSGCIVKKLLSNMGFVTARCIGMQDICKGIYG